MNFKKISGGLTSTATNIATKASLLGLLTFTPLLTMSLQTSIIGDTPLGTSLFSHTSVFAADDEPRKPPQARSSQTLSSRVSSRVVEVMEFRDMEDYPAALEVLGEIKEMYDDDRLNEREEHTMWLFYATLAQIQDQYPEALEYWAEILAMEENLTADQFEQALASTGALRFVQEEYREAIDIYLRLIDVVETPTADHYYRLGVAHYNLEEYVEAIPYILKNMEIVRAGGDEVSSGTYGLLRALYFSTDDYVNTLQVLREMVVLFNEPGDWTFMAGMEGQLDKFDEQARTYYVSNLLGNFDDEGQVMTLASLLYNYENPYGAAMIVKEGIDKGLVEETEDNLANLSQFYQVAREDLLAVAPLLRAAEMSDDGELYNRLGIVYSNMAQFEDAIDAFDLAFQKGGLDRPDQVYIRQSVAYYYLDRYEEGIAAAREAGKDERSEDASSSWVQSHENAKRIYDRRESDRELYKDYFL